LRYVICCTSRREKNYDDEEEEVEKDITKIETLKRNWILQCVVWNNRKSNNNKNGDIRGRYGQVDGVFGLFGDVVGGIWVKVTCWMVLVSCDTRNIILDSNNLSSLKFVSKT